MFRHRWQASIAIAISLHAFVVLRFCGDEPLPLHARARGTFAPSYMHMIVIESAHKGATVAPTVPLSLARGGNDELRFAEPEHPREGLWVLNAKPCVNSIRFAVADDALAQDAGP